MEKTTQQNDHDLLIALNTKFDYMSQDIKKLADGTTATLIDHDTRLKALEKLRDEVQPLELLREIKVLKEMQDQVMKNQEINKRINKSYWKLFATISGIVWGILTLIVSNWQTLVKLFK